MATIMNAENQILINEEIVLKDRSYKLQKHREFYLLTGKNKGFSLKRIQITVPWADR